jgi:hypothetical protein
MLEMGEYAVERILKSLHRSDGNRDGFHGQIHIMLPELVLRESTGTRARADFRNEG